MEAVRLLMFLLGRPKESLDQVNFKLAVAEVTAMFGPFVKYTVDKLPLMRR